MESNWDNDLPENWTKTTISDLVGIQGVFRDGDWVESKDQDQNGQVRLIQLADIGDGEFRDKSSRFLIPEKAIELNCTFLQAGDILVARMPDPLGRACLFPLHGDKQFVTVVDVCIIRFGNDYTNTKYFMYMLNSPMSRRSISGHQTGSTRKRISRGNLSTIQFPIAPLNEQHRIVAKIEELFSELDKGIENLKTAQSQLKVYRQALLKHAFEGKLTAQWRAERNVTPAKAGVQPLSDMDSRLPPAFARVTRNDEVGGGNDKPLETADTLLKRIQQERAQRYQQQLAEWEKSPSAPSQALPLKQRGKPTSTAPIHPLEKGGRGGISKPKPPKSLPPLTAEELAGLPELPEGWGWVRLLEACEAVVDCHNKTAPYQATGISLVRTPSIRDMKLNFDDSIRYVSQETYEYWSRRCPPLPGDILFTREAPMGEAALIPEGKMVCMGQRIMLFRPGKFLSGKYLLSATQNPIFKRVADKAAVGTGVKHLRVGDVERLVFPLCSMSEQNEIANQLDALLSEADQLDQTITTALQQAEALRQSILKKAFSGQLVPQDPNDEPASELLARIKAERADTALRTKRKTT